MQYIQCLLNREPVTSVVLKMMGTKEKNTETPLSFRQFHISEGCGFILPEPLVGHSFFFANCNIVVRM